MARERLSHLDHASLRRSLVAIRESYVSERPMLRVVAAALNGIGALDGRLVVYENDRTIALSHDNRDVARYRGPPDDAIDAWGALAERLITDAASLSPAVRAAASSRRLDAMLAQGMYEFDPHSHYDPPDETRPAARGISTQRSPSRRLTPRSSAAAVVVGEPLLSGRDYRDGTLAVPARGRCAERPRRRRPRSAATARHLLSATMACR